MRKHAFLCGVLALPALGAAQYAGLYISETVSRPTEDEAIEIVNTTGSAMDVSGVVVADEETAAAEGAIAFPAGTILAPGEIVVVAVNTSATEPTWLDTLPSGTRVFIEPARSSAAWTPNTAIPMVDVASVSGSIQLSGTDGVALFQPSVTFSGSGYSSATLCIDGINWDPSGPYLPINSTGQLDTAATEIAEESETGNGWQRLRAALNTGSLQNFVDAPHTIGRAAFPGDIIDAAEWHERVVGEGVVLKTFRFDNLFDSSQIVYVFDADLDAPGVSLKFPYLASTLRTVPAHAATVSGARACINGNFFNLAGGGGSVQYLKVDGTFVNATSAQDEGGVIIEADGDVDVLQRPPAGWDATYTADANTPSVMATNVPVVLNGGGRDYTNSAFYMTDRHPRTLVGMTPDNHLLLVSVDGRSTIASGMTMVELSTLMMALGCDRAVNMDGGGSTTCWDADAPGNGVTNIPSDGTPRGVANGLAVVAPAPATTPAYKATRTNIGSHASHHAPISLTVGSGQVANVSISFVNKGTTTWTSSTVFLATTEERDRTSQLHTLGDWVSPTRPTAMNQASVAPGATGTFTFQVTAPTTGSVLTIKESFGLVTDGGLFFGPEQNRVHVTVVPDSLAGEVVVESCLPDATVTPSPAYVETGSFSLTTSKSTAGPPALIGSRARFSTTVGSTARFRPTLTVAGEYDVYVTIGTGSNNNANASFLIDNTGADVTGNVALTFNDSTVVNQWKKIASNVHFDAGTGGSVLLTNLDGNNGSGARFVSDAVRFSLVTPDPSNVDDWSAY